MPRRQANSREADDFSNGITLSLLTAARPTLCPDVVFISPTPDLSKQKTAVDTRFTDG